MKFGKILVTGLLTAALLALCLAAAGCGAAPAASIPDDLESTVTQILLDQTSSGYLEGECAAEGHIILDTVPEGDQTQVYLLASVGQYGFCSGHFEKISGSGAIPTRITLAQDEHGGYTLAGYWVPEDGSYYADSIKETFPAGLQDQALNSDSRYNELAAQEQVYAQAYLDSIGREAPIGEYGDFDHPLATDQGMSVEVSNDLLAARWDFPYFLGNVEQVEDGVRYVYETAWDSDGSGTGTATFTKYEYDTNKIVQKYIYQVEGDTYQEVQPQGPGPNQE